MTHAAHPSLIAVNQTQRVSSSSVAMRLTIMSDYSLRVLMYVGARPGRLATIREISEAYRISENHLMKVVHRLAQHGFIETRPR